MLQVNQVKSEVRIVRVASLYLNMFRLWSCFGISVFSVFRCMILFFLRIFVTFAAGGKIFDDFEVHYSIFKGFY